jgi:hypothetical protein
MTQTTPAQQKKALQIAIAKAAIEQITALNRTLAQAEMAGVRIDVVCRGYSRQSPKVSAIYDTTTKSYRSLYKEAFQ